MQQNRCLYNGNLTNDVINTWVTAGMLHTKHRRIATRWQRRPKQHQLEFIMVCSECSSERNDKRKPQNLLDQFLCRALALVSFPSADSFANYLTLHWLQFCWNEQMKMMKKSHRNRWSWARLISFALCNFIYIPVKWPAQHSTALRCAQQSSEQSESKVTACCAKECKKRSDSTWICEEHLKCFAPWNFINFQSHQIEERLFVGQLDEHIKPAKHIYNFWI